MGIFKRIKTITTSGINGLLDKTEDPIAMLNEYLREMEQELNKAQSAISKQLFAENKQSALIAQTKENIGQRTRQATSALQKGDEAAAKLAVGEKIYLEQQLSLYNQQLDAIKEQTVVLKDKFSELQTTLNELGQKKTVLASRANVAKNAKQIQTITVSFGGDNILKGVTRMEEKILFLEAEVQACGYTPNPLNSADKTVSEEAIAVELNKLMGEKEAI
ncbi:PspA/IM30 family protein [Niallia circulans]|uniref:PspA/IM30 family protein n=1 Tax=Niallia circulans TaxID=1397 RepID=A0A553SR27_NIACI|nr:PspA/IM30 family protein [Niallia circulans]TRZ39440.1 PspA/IM30 family protein [Niallia circulans]